MKKVLIFGGTGFVGSYLSTFAKSIGWNVTSFARNPNPYADLSIEKDLAKDSFSLHQNYDLIIHAAGVSGGGKNVEGYVSGNVLTTHNITKNIKESYKGKLIYLSGISLYRNTKCEIIDEKTEVCDPDEYSQSKMFA